MQFQLFKSQDQFKDNFGSISGDIAFFDDAFDTDSLKRFYRQQAQPALTVCTNFAPLFAKAKTVDFDFDGASSPSIDERETQASPLTRYINKFSQESSPAGNLDYQFYGEHDPIYESNHISEIPRQPVENYFAKSAVGQQTIKLQDCKPTTYPQLNMNIANSMFFLTKCAQPSLAVCRKDTQSTDCSDTDRSPTGFEKLLKTKKIFKIQRDTKPRVVPKQKVSSPKMKPVKIPAPKGISLSKIEIPIQAAPVFQERSPVKVESVPNMTMNFLSNMHEQGYTPEQVMSQIQRFMNPNAAENFSAKKN